MTVAKIRLQHQAAAERLHHDHCLDRPAAEAAMRFRERQAEQTEFGVLLPDGAAPAVGFGHVFLALLELVLIGDQPIDAVLQQSLFVGEIEVHDVSSVPWSLRSTHLRHHIA